MEPARFIEGVFGLSVIYPQYNIGIWHHKRYNDSITNFKVIKYMNIKGVLLSLVLIILALVGGVWLGMNVIGKTSVGMGGAKVANSTILTALTSKVIPSVGAYGQVAKIDGNNLTISYQGDSIVVTVGGSAKIYAQTIVKKGTVSTPTTQQISLQNIKVGDNVSVNIKVQPTGQLQGLSIVVLPPTSGS